MPHRVALHHATEYRYSPAVQLSPQEVRLRPAPHCRTPIDGYSLRIMPDDHFLNWQQDPFGNYLARLVFPERTPVFRVEVDLTAEMAVINPFDFFVEPSAEEFPFHYEPSLAKDLQPYLETEPAGPKLSEFLDPIGRAPRNTVSFLVELNSRLEREIEYVKRLEPGVRPGEETLSHRSGSCRDTGWLLVQVLRQLGLASRFASGYLVQLVPDEKPAEGPGGPDEDCAELHAWAEAFLPGAGWVGLDPTSGLLAGQGHIPLACTPRPSSAAPITGSVGECEVEFEVKMSVTRIEQEQ